MPDLVELIFRRWGEKLTANAKENLKRGKFGITSGANGRTGRLANSLFSRQRREYVMEFGGGSNVDYARAHELGFSQPVNVRSHVRTSVAGEPYTVRSHMRRMNIRGKFYLHKTGEEFFRSREPEDIARGAFNYYKRKLGFE